MDGWSDKQMINAESDPESIDTIEDGPQLLLATGQT